MGFSIPFLLWKARPHRYAARLDVAHDAGAAPDRNPFANFERLLAAQVSGGDHLVAAPELVPVVRHRRVAPPRPPRYAPERISLVVSPARSTDATASSNWRSAAGMSAYCRAAR